MRPDPYDLPVPAAPTYDLPEWAIAQVPVEPRDTARLLVDRGPHRPPDHRTVHDLPSLMRPGDVLVLNETRVLPARLRLTKPSGGAVEVLLLEPDADQQSWRALVRPSRRVEPGTVLVAGEDLAVEVGDRLPGGERRVRVVAPDVDAALERHGELPLPPYIHEALRDPERYEGIIVEAIHLDREKPRSREFFLQMIDDPDAFGERVTRKLADEHGEDYWRTIIRAGGRAWRDIAATPNEDFYEHRLHELRVPMLVVHGADDPRTEPGELDRIRREVPTARIEMIEGGGHSPHSTRATAAQVTAIVDGFLESLPGP